MPNKPISGPQIDRFREAAREIGAGESEERFNAALKKVAKANPEKNKPPSAKHPKR